MSKAQRPNENVKQMFDALHIAEMQMLADLHTRIQQPVEKSANETIVKVVQDAIVAGHKEGCVCDCHPVVKSG